MDTALRIEIPEAFHAPLSAAQEKMLKTIIYVRDKNGLFPTYGEIAEELSITGQSVYDSVCILIKKGYLRRKHPRKSRSLEIVFNPFE